MKEEQLKEFKQKKEENKLSPSAYNNLTHNNPNTAITIKEKISIIIPTYNRFPKLKKLIHSIFNQTYQNYEIIIIDDMSNDETKEICSNYPNKHIKYYRNQEKLGSGLSRQKGYNLAHGDYIIFCDNDDYYIDNDYFQDIINIFKDKNINIICSESYTHYEQEDKYVYASININNEIIDSIEYLKNFMTKYKKPKSTFSTIFRRKTLVEARFKEMTMMNDTSIYLRALMMGGNTYINKKIVGVYSVRTDNITFHLKPDFIIKNLEEKKKIYEYLKKQKTIPNIYQWYSQQIAITVNYFLKYNQDMKAADKVINWVKENVSYDEYLKYKKQQINSSYLTMYYFKRRPNFGDMLNEDILTTIFNQKFQFDTTQNADICCIGSILDHFITETDNNSDNTIQDQYENTKPFHIWGTGLMYFFDDNIHLTSPRPLIIHALRGEKTRKRISKLLGKNISCTLADPGILASQIVQPTEKKYLLGIIPHFHDRNEEIFKKMLQHYPNSIIIDVQDEPQKVLKEISECEYIISTSLHGLIVADSYAIPNCWCEISDRVQGNGFKFHDYFSSYGTDRQYFDLRTGELPDLEKDFKCNYKSFEQIQQKQDELIECFPFKSSK